MGRQESFFCLIQLYVKWKKNKKIPDDFRTPCIGIYQMETVVNNSAVTTTGGLRVLPRDSIEPLWQGLASRYVPHKQTMLTWQTITGPISERPGGGKIHLTNNHH